MRKLTAVVVLVLVCLLDGALAQSSQSIRPLSSQDMTIDATVGGVAFAAGTLTVTSGGVTRRATMCRGILETGDIRVRDDGGAPTATDGLPVTVGQEIVVRGTRVLAAWRGIRQTGTSGRVWWNCYQE